MNSKSSFILGNCLLLPIVWFVTYVLLVLVGLIAFSFGAGDDFYCNIYCKLGIYFYLASTVGFFAFTVYRFAKKCQTK